MWQCLFSLLEFIFSPQSNWFRDCGSRRINDFSVHLSTSVPDARVWALTSSGLFSIKSFFLALSKLSNLVMFHPTKFIWKSKVSSKVKAFAWLVAHKVNTNDLLQLRRTSKALRPEWHILCRGSEETNDYLFLHCPFTLRLWHRLFLQAKMIWVHLGISVIWCPFPIWILGTSLEARHFGRLLVSL